MGGVPQRKWPEGFINKVICGDCLEILPLIPDGAVDFIFGDAPYGIGLDYYADFEDTPSYIVENAPKWIEEMERVLHPAGLIAITCGIRNIASWPPADWVACWHYKSYDSRCPFGFNQWQPILLYGKDRTVQFGCRPDVIEHLEVSVKSGHPCPKPDGFMKKIIQRFGVPENGLILDPFAGSGTTLVAAKQLGRRYIGIEISPEYCKIAEDRLRQGELFNQ